MSVLSSNTVSVSVSTPILVNQIVQELADHLRDVLKGIDLQTNRINPNVVHLIAQKVISEFHNKDQLKKIGNLTPDDLIIQVLKLLIPNLCESEIKQIKEVLTFLNEHQIIGNKNLSYYLNQFYQKSGLKTLKKTLTGTS